MLDPELEMVRLAIPRRVYTNMQIAYVAESIVDLYRRRESIHGLTIDLRGADVATLYGSI